MHAGACVYILGAQPLNLNLGFIGEVHHVAEVCMDMCMCWGKYIRVDLVIYLYIPQTVFSCRGSGGVGKDAGGPVPPPREF